MSENELNIALAFAQLEIVELKAGKRTLTQCPGLKSVGKYIAEAEIKAASEVSMTLVMERYHVDIADKHGEALAAVAIVRQSFGRRTQLFERPDYSESDATHVVRWLRDRAAGYPVPATLSHLWSAPHDKPKPTARKRKSSRGRRSRTPARRK